MGRGRRGVVVVYTYVCVLLRYFLTVSLEDCAEAEAPALHLYLLPPPLAAPPTPLLLLLDLERGRSERRSERTNMRREELAGGPKAYARTRTRSGCTRSGCTRSVVCVSHLLPLHPLRPDAAVNRGADTLEFGQVERAHGT